MSEQQAQQLKFTEQLNESLKEILKTSELVNDTFTKQSKVVKQIVDAMKELKPKETAEQFQELNDSVKEAEKNIKKTGDGGSGSMKKLGINADKLEKHMGKIGKTTIYATAALSGFKQGLKNLVAMGKSLTSFFLSITKGVVKFATSIASIPFKMFKGLIDEAQNLPNMIDLAIEIENVRKQFGQLGQPSAKAILETTKTMGGFSETGLSTWRVFGTLAERMAYIRELATGMGVAWSHMVNNMDMKHEGGHILAYAKGLGLAAEQMKGLYDKSVVTGKKITELGVEMTKYSYALSKQFGMSAKEVSRDVGKAMQDVKHFGQLTVKEINVAATYARKLNIEFEKITGTLDAFETFDTAAENASKLAQSFGLNVDAFKMMEAQNPADQMDMLRKSMFAAGKSSDNMSRQELKLLSQSTGLDEATTKLAFSYKNQGVSLDEVKKKANLTENAQMRQTEAMKTLAGAIERMIKTMDMEKMTGFFDAFVKGILSGIRMSPEYIKLMANIKVAMWATWREGMNLGRELIDIIPGMKDFFQTLQAIFDPKKYQQNAEKVRHIIEDFFKEMSTGKFSFSKMMDTLEKTFYNFFDARTPEGMKLLAKIKNFFLKFGEIVGEAITYFSEKLANGLLKITEFLKNPEAVIAGAREGGKGAMSFVVKLLDPIVNAIKESWPLLQFAFGKLFGVVWEKIKEIYKSDKFTSFVHGIIPAMIGIVAGPVVTKVGTVGLVDVFTKVIWRAVEKTFEKGSIEKISEFAGSRLGQAIGTGTAIAAVIAVGMAISSGVKKFKGKIVGEFSDAQKDIAAGVTGIIDTLTFGLLPNWLLEAVVNFGAQMVKKMQEMLNNVHKGLGNAITGYLQGYMKLFGGIGDIIFGIFQGDGDRLVQGIGNIIEGAIKMMWRGIQLQFWVLPQMMGKFAVKILTNVLSGISNAMASLFEYFGLTGFAKIFRGIADAYKQVGRLIGNVFEFISSMVDTFVTFVTGLFDDTNKGLMGTIVKLGVTIFKFVVSLTPAYQILKAVGQLLVIAWEKLAPLAEHVGNVIMGTWKFKVSPFLDAAAEKIKWLTEKVAWAADFMEKLTEAGSVAQAKIFADQRKMERASGPAVSSMQKSMKELGKAGRDAVEEDIQKNGSLLDALLKGGDKIDVASSPSKAIDAASQALDRVEDMKKKLEGLTPEKLEPLILKVQKIFDAKGPFMKFISNMNTYLQGPEFAQAAQAMQEFNKTIIDSGIVPALQAVQTMVNMSNELSKSLATGNVAQINVKAGLTKMATGVGLGGKANYTIQNRGVTIQVNMTVEMSAGELEAGLIMRGKSIIRDRLEHAEYSKEGTAGVPHLPTTASQPLAEPETYFAHPA